MKRLSYTPIIILLIVALVLAIVTLTWLNKRQRKNRYYDKKGVWLYALVSLLVFALLGLFALGDLNELRQQFQLFQAIILVLGVLHAWLLFQLFAWADRNSFIPENLLTLLMAAIGVLGGLGSFWALDHFVNKESEGAVLNLAWAFLIFPLPYLMLRVYDLMLGIPSPIYRAWRYPSYPKPEFPVVNFKHVTVSLDRSGFGSGRSQLIQQAHLPNQVRLGDFFHRFVEIYNENSPHAQIENLRAHGSDQLLGWVFYLKVGGKGSKRSLDPEMINGGQEIEAGDVILAKRVKLDPETPEPQARSYAPQSSAQAPPDDLNLELGFEEVGGDDDDDLD
ncbi:MAG: TssN family type VI secretion system protein, partial [Bacteroidota bacterium]